MESKPKTLKEKLIIIAHRFTKLGIVHRSPDLVSLALKKVKNKKLDDIADILDNNTAWCWEDVAKELRNKFGRDPVRMEAWLDFARGNKMLMRETLKHRNPEDYPEIPKEKWDVDTVSK